MTPEQILAWAQAAQLLVAAGAATVATLKGIFSGAQISEEDQNKILDAIIANASTRKWRSKEIAES